MRHTFQTRIVGLLVILAGTQVACESTKPTLHGIDASAGGGMPGSGGVPGSGGALASGGIVGTGGIVSTGGSHASGGAAGAGSGGLPMGGSAGAGSGGSATGGLGGPTTGGAGGGGMGGASLDAGCPGSKCAIDSGHPDAPLPACNQVTTEAACNMRGDCHSVFAPKGSCSCDGGDCCIQFDHCADGLKADCAGPALCKSMAPNCPSPYAVSFTGTCYEGCVRQSECPAPTCPAAAPSNGTACGPVDQTCFYESCATTGRTLAKCSGGTWKIETAACATITCAGGGITPGSVTCDVGKVCVVRTSTGGAYTVTASCADSKCGTGPVTTECISGVDPNCSITTGLSGITVRCSTYTSCGSGQGGCS